MIVSGLASATPAFAEESGNPERGNVAFTDVTPYVQTFDGYGPTDNEAMKASWYAMRAAAVKIGGVDRCAKLDTYVYSQEAEDVFWGKTRAYCADKKDYAITTENLDGPKEQQQQLMDTYSATKKAKGCTPLSANWYNVADKVYITAHSLCPASSLG
jgi:hypothetical protein